MNTQTSSDLPVQTSKSRLPFVLIIVALLFALAIVAFLATSLMLVSISGEGEQYVLKPNQTRLGILILDEGATAIFREKSHWIGPVISKHGALTIEEGVTITGPVSLFSNDLRLREDATVDGSVYLFSGGLALEPGASIRHNAVLFAGGLLLGPEASVRGDAISFARDVELQEKATLRGDAVLFAGDMRVGSEAAAYGELISFAGGLKLAPKAVLHDDAVLFFGNVHLTPETQVRGDVILTEGNAELEDQSTIDGRLYLNPDPNLGRLYKSSEAQITRGVVEPENIKSIAGWRVGSWVLARMLRIIALPVVIVCLLMILMFYLGQRTRLPKNQNRREAGQGSRPQPTTPGLRQ